MPQAVNLKNVGLYTYANQLGAVPPGGMVAAINTVINALDVIDTRPGFQTFGSKFADSIHKLFAYQGKIIVHHGTTLTYDTSGSGTWQNYAGTFDPITNEKIRSAIASKNFYFTTDNGIYKIDSVTQNPYQAGGVAGLDITGALSGSSGFLSTNSQCAYRMTWIYTDANNNLIEGSPSESVVLSNSSGGTRDVALTFTVPSSVTTAFSYRIYRTPQTNDINVTPSDNFQLAAEISVTTAQIAAKVVTVTDSTPDSLLGTLLYTSASDQGELQANDPPPLATDITTFQNMTFYANVSTLQQVFMTMVGVGSPNGVQNGDTITIQGTTNHVYTGASSNDFTIGQFKVETGGSDAQNIDATARNLVSAVNRDPNNSEVYAYYLSGYSHLPGEMLLQARNLSGTAFSVVSTRGGAFSPALPSSGTSYISSNNSSPGSVLVSKLGQPEAVPPVNSLPISTGTVFRIFALRDAVIALCSDGVFRIAGNSPNALNITPLDNTIILKGNETAVVLNNSVYCFTSQGVVSLGSGSKIVSLSIEGDLRRLSAPTVFTNFNSLAYGIGYESSREYILGIASDRTSTTSNLQYVVNWITNARTDAGFTTWTIDTTCGFVNPTDDRCYLGASDGYVLQERKTSTFQDFTDRQFPVSISGVSGTEITVNGTSMARVGYSLVQGISVDGITRESIISSIVSPTLLTVEDELSWTGGNATMFSPIGATVSYAPITGGYPNYMKRWEPVAKFAFGNASFQEAVVQFTTDITPTLEGLSLVSPIASLGLSPQTLGTWGTFNWGTLAWPSSLDAALPLQNIPCIIPRSCLMGSWLNVSIGLNQAFRNMSLQGCQLFYDIATNRSR